MPIYDKKFQKFRYKTMIFTGFLSKDQTSPSVYKKDFRREEVLRLIKII